MNDISTPGIHTERHGRVGILKIHNPKRRNAINRHLRQELNRCVKEMMEDEGVVVVIITGAGDHFSAGADISEMRVRSIPEYQELHVESARAICDLMKGRKPVIAAVEGIAFGAGLSLVCAADFVVAARTARFCAAFMRVGLIPDMGMLWTLPEKVGRAKASELMALATEFGADEALQFGLASQIAAPGRALEDAITLAEGIGKNPPISMALIKSALTSFNHSFNDSLNVEVDYQSILRSTSDHREAVCAFMEKRVPEFSGK